MVFGFERAGVRRGPSSAQPTRMFGTGSGCACGQWLEERSAAALVSNAYVMAAHGEPLGTSITTRPFRFEISVTLWVMTAGLISRHYSPWTSDKDTKDSIRRAVGQLTATKAIYFTQVS